LIAGERLKEIRNRLNISTRDVEELSRKIADAEGNDEFFVSNPWLTQIENHLGSPSIYKLYSISVIYRIKFSDLLILYGIDLEKIGKYQATCALPETHLTQLEIYDEDRPVQFPVRFDPGFSIDRTNLLSRMVEIWGEIPIALIRHLDLRRCLFGYIGMNDYSLYPILRPGSFVQIDNKRTKIQPPPWKDEYSRPIYFIELREGYACSWCELKGKTLFLIPHPLSGYGIRQYAYPDDAGVVGRVTGVAMQIVDSEPTLSTDDAPKLPRPFAR